MSEDAWNNNKKILEGSWNKIRVLKNEEALMLGSDKSLGSVLDYPLICKNLNETDY